MRHPPGALGCSLDVRAPELVQSIREWCGRTDTHLSFTPVIALAEQAQVDSDEIPDRLKTRIRLTHTKCVFPLVHPPRPRSHAGALCQVLSPRAPWDMPEGLLLLHHRLRMCLVG